MSDSAARRGAGSKRWSYRQITEHTERQIRHSMELGAKGDADNRRIHRLFALGAYQCWSSLTMGWQEPGDDHRLAVLADAYCMCDGCLRERERAADSAAREKCLCREYVGDALKIEEYCPVHGARGGHTGDSAGRRV